MFYHPRKFFFCFQCCSRAKVIFNWRNPLVRHLQTFEGRFFSDDENQTSLILRLVRQEAGASVRKKQKEKRGSCGGVFKFPRLPPRMSRKGQLIYPVRKVKYAIPPNPNTQRNGCVYLLFNKNHLILQTVAGKANWY